MNIRIYYDYYGVVKGIVVIDDEDWNLAECISSSKENSATFPLSKEILEIVMDGATCVNLREIERYRDKQSYDN